ncbi:MAG: indole-3-glycerol phosphate synthase TrpC [Chloroflexi bacterium]|nr:MAG: indole-3-glycerol phosphate synthase TrpC [Chloroflexota bacterium]
MASAIIDQIVAQKKVELARLLAAASRDQLRAQAEAGPAVRDFVKALRAGKGSLSLIAEIKRKSPSKGVFCASLDAAQLARRYEQSGAACLSVLTDEPFFMGTLDDLRSARAAVTLPILRKDFMLDAAQIWQARAAGADAILLIAAILDDEQLPCLAECAHELGMAALIEIHDEHELRRVLPLSPALVGLNNRDLKTFQTDLHTSERLRPMLPADCTVVAESAIHTRVDVERLERAGINAILVGESLVLARDVDAKIRELLGRAAV